MWLRRLVAISMIITCVGLNAIVLKGILDPVKKTQAVSVAVQPELDNQPAVSSVPVPTVQLSAQPSTIIAGSSSALSWTTTGSPATCTASGAWTGAKTAFGSESTGRLSKSNNYVYTITCSNSAGKAEASTTITVGNAPAPAKSSTQSSTATAQAPSYCGGRLPCYGSREIAAHSGAGNCWGWNANRVLNISAFDAAFHTTKSAISSIEISQICGHDLSPALNGQVSAGGRTRVHNQTTKTNADANEIPYFVGYFDSAKP